MALLVVFISFMIQYFFIVNGDGKSTSFIISPEALLADIPESAQHQSALRYGFQDTRACKNFKKAFLCVRKCLDLNYDVARSDKSCVCRCFKKKDKFNPNFYPVTATNYKSGAPKTFLPYWAIVTIGHAMSSDEYDDQPDSNTTSLNLSNSTAVPAQNGNSTAAGPDGNLGNSTVPGGDDGAGGDAGVGNSTDGGAAGAATTTA